VWGHPAALNGKQDDTANARTLRMGILKNLPVCVDEMTNMTGLQSSDFIYGMTHGTGKDRMRQHSNTLRANNTTWQTIAVCTSNASFQDKLRTVKASPDGELMRLFEYNIDYTSILDPMYAKEMFDKQLMENYGHAGIHFMEWVVSNLTEAEDIFGKVQHKFDTEMQIKPKERIWSALVTSNIAGGYISQRLGLNTYNIKSVYDWTCLEVVRQRADIAPPELNVADVIGDYINLNIQNTLVVDDAADKRTGIQCMPKQEPRGELKIRFEPDTKRVFLCTKQFRQFCSEQQQPYKDVMDNMRKSGLLKSTGTKRIGKGMKVCGPPVYCLELDFAHPVFGGVDVFTEG
jgi:hypothetical protein